MAILKDEDLNKLRRAMVKRCIELGEALDFPPKPEINNAFQECEDLIAASSFNADAMVKVVTTIDEKSQKVEKDLNDGKFQAELKDVIEIFISEHPPVIIDRSVDVPIVDTWLATNKSLFASSINDLSSNPINTEKESFEDVKDFNKMQIEIKANLDPPENHTNKIFVADYTTEKNHQAAIKDCMIRCCALKRVQEAV